MNTEKENNSLKNKDIKNIYNITKFTRLDYPNELACIIWFSGCNMRCLYCYNNNIVLRKTGKYSEQDILDYLKTRIGKLSAVVLSGGEATSSNLLDLCKEIKSMGFKIKLDTNGLNFNQIKTLIKENLLDYIALDYKAPIYKFKEITMSDNFFKFNQTLSYLIKNFKNFEVRTTLHKDLLNESDINYIIKDLYKKGYDKNYYIQNYLQTDTNLGNIKEELNEFKQSEIYNYLNIIYRN